MPYTTNPVEFSDAFQGRRQWLHAGLDETVSHYPGDHDNVSIHFGVFLNSNLVGVGSILPDDGYELAQKKSGRLRGMAIDPKHRQKGAGRLLMQALLTAAKKEYPTGLWLTGRKEATLFYQKFGFEVQGPPIAHPAVGNLYFMRLSF